MKLEKRVAIVTGGANGIGRAIALGLAREGAYVAIADLESERADEVVRKVKALGQKAIGIKVDVSKSNEVKSMAKTVLNDFGKIDILINNAGGMGKLQGQGSPFAELKEADWDYIFDINIKGVFNCSRAVIEHMIQSRSGKIVSISSCAGLIGDPQLVHYSAAKAGIIGFTLALAKEVVSYGINVNSVAPGPIDTRVYHKMPKDSVEHFRKLSGLGLGKPEDVASLVVFLSTDDAKFITGQVYPICGVRNLGT